MNVHMLKYYAVHWASFIENGAEKISRFLDADNAILCQYNLIRQGLARGQILISVEYLELPVINGAPVDPGKFGIH